MITRKSSGFQSGLIKTICMAGVGLCIFDGLFGAAPTGSVTISGTPQVGQTLAVSNDLADADGLGVISYQWFRDGQPIMLGGTLKDGVNGVDGLGAARKVTLSPDGNYAYVTAHDDDAVSWYERNASTGALTYGGKVKDGVGGADGLDGANSVALSAHGEYAYVSAPADSAVSWYERNSTTGTLTFGGMAKDGVGGFNGLNYAGDIVLSKDGNRGYVTALDKLIWFEHNQTTGTLELGGSLSDGVGGVDGLHRARGVSLSPDGLHLYVVGNYDQTISWFEYNSGSEVLSFVGLLRDGIGGVDGLGGPRDTAISPDGAHVYVTTEGDDAIGWFERNASTGSLSYGGMVKDGVGGVDGLDNAQAIAISPGGRFAYATSVTENSVSWFSRNPVTGSLTYGGLLKDGINGVDGLARPLSVALSSDDMYAYVTGTDDDSVSWFTRDPATGALLYGSASDANYTLTQADLGKTITVVASYVDGGGTPETVSSAGSSSVNPVPLSDPGSIQPGNLKLWLDANHSSASGSTWNDQSASSNHATKNGSPTLVPNAQNGLPVMRYAGTNGEYHSFNDITDIRTVFWVLKYTGGLWFILGDNNQYHFHSNGSNSMFSSNHASMNIKDGSFFLNGSSSDMYGPWPTELSILSLRTTGDVEASSFSSERNISGRYANGDLAELIIYNKALSDAEIQKIEGYLAHKWGLTHQLLFSHPYKYGAVTISGTPLVGETLTVSNDLADPDGVGAVGYQWYRDGLPVNMLKDGVNGVDGLDGAWGVTLSADGQHAYVTGGADDAISWYERNASTGALTYGGMLKEGVNGVDGLDGAWGVTLSGDGHHVYVAGQVDNAVSWFERNASTGALTYGGMLKDGVGGVDGLWGARGVTLSGDGQHAYVTGQNDTAVSWYERNASTGALSYVGMLKEGVGGVDGLWGARGVTLSGDGQHAYVTGHADDAVSWYERNASTGALTYGGMLKDGVGGVDGLDFAFDLTLSADGNHSYVTGSEDDAVSWYERNATTGALTYGGMFKDGVGGVDGLDNAGGVTLSGDGQHAYVTGQNDTAVSWYERNASTGALSYVGMLKDGLGGVDGLNGAWNVTLSADGNHAYVTGGTDDAISWYERNSSTGALSFGSPSNSNYTLTAIDAGSVIKVVASYANGNGTAKNVTSLYSQTVNTPPADLNFTAPLTIAENQPVGTIVGEFNATDPDAGATLTYELLGGFILNDATAPSGGNVTASTSHSTYPASKAFDNELTANGRWLTRQDQLPNVFVRYDFGSSVKIENYRITAQHYLVDTRSPKSWQLLGSNDDLNWSLLSSESNQTNWTTFEQRAYRVSNSANFRFYKLVITEATGADTWLGIAEVELFKELQISNGINSLFTLETNGALKTATTFDYETNASTYSIRVQAKDEFNASVEGNFTVTLQDVYEPSQPNHFVDLNATANLEMLWVEPGTFTMGSPTGEAGRSSNEQEHNVTLTKGFYLGKYEVTQAQYEAVMTGNGNGLSATPSNWPNNPNRPVEQVSWDDAQVFLARLNAAEQAVGRLPNGWAYVLPTESQWEYACRAGTTTVYSWGNTITSANASYNNTTGHTANVGQYAANPWGFFDMHGNVREWTADRYGTYPTGNPVIDPPGTALGSYRVRRGGSWNHAGPDLRSAKRYYDYPSARSINLGFRVGFQEITTVPSNLAFTAPLTIAENQPIGTMVGEFNATDPDAGATLTYHLVSGAGDGNNSLFTLEANGTLKTATTFDYESNASTYTIRVQAKDEFNATVEGNFTVSLTDVYEPSQPPHAVQSAANLEMIWVEPGTFTMGSPTGEANRGTNETEHNVTLTKGFYLGKYEVTQAQYEAVMTGNGSGLSATPSSYFGNPNRPVERVSWDDVQIFLTRLNTAESNAGRLPSGWAYALPTESQWEYACRAGTTSATSFGDGISSMQANFDGTQPYGGAATGPNVGQTTDVGSYNPNSWGFFDMHGNVWEWCTDWFVDYPIGPVSDPIGPPAGTKRINRGGSWSNAGTSQRAAWRNRTVPNPRINDMGFRLAYRQITTPPGNLNSTAPLTFAENQPIGTVVGEFNATDPDAGATLTYHLVNGAGDTHNTLFTLEANGTLKTATTFDYESNASTYSIRVQAKDEFNATVEGNFTVTLTDIDESFTDITSEVGISVGGVGAWGDFDNDGDVDLLTSSKLYINEGNGSFLLSGDTFAAGSAIWVDVDNDRDLDLFTHTGSTGSAQFYINQGNGWSEQSAAMGLTPGGEAASWGDYDQDGDMDLFLTRSSGAPTNDIIFRNDNLSFTQVQSSLGLNYSTFGRRSGWVDYDGDGDLDLHALAGNGSSDLLFRNTSGSFQNVASAVGLAFGTNGNSSAWGDLDGDGDLDGLFTFGDSAPLLLKNNGSTFNSFPGSYAINTNIIEGYASFLDVDCDGDTDLIMPSSGGYDVYKNTGSGLEVQPLLTGQSTQGYNISYADYDGDGDLDLLVYQSSVLLLRNNSNPSPDTYLKIVPVVGDKLRNAYGATVRLYAADNSIFGSSMIDVGLGNQDEYGAWFYGLSPGASYQVEVVFPTGTTVRSSSIVPRATEYIMNESGTFINLNQIPTGLNATAPLTFAENQPIGTVVGEFNATDLDVNATLSYSLVSGTGDGNNSLFTLETNGTLKTATTFDYETNASTYSIRVQAKDEFNATVEGNFTVTLTDVNDSTPSGSVKVQDGLILYFSFDETNGTAVIDYSGKNRNAILQDIPGTDLNVAGKFGSGLKLGDSPRSRIDMGLNAVDLPNNWTISVWLEAPLKERDSVGDLLIDYWHTLASGAGGDVRHVLFDKEGSKELGVYDPATAGWVTSGYGGNSMTAGWHHLAAIGIGSKTVFFVDGLNVGTSNYKINEPIDTIGNIPAGFEGLTDKIDDFRVYGRALSSSEVGILYGGGSGDFYPPTHTVELNSTISLEMIWVEPGTFTMGSPTGEANRGTDETEHNVTLTKGFYLGKYEVTQAQYESVMTGNTNSLSATPSQWPGNPNRPVEKVSWGDVQIFLTRLNESEQAAGRLPAGWSYVLPTESQWEYACRAGTSTAYFWGATIANSNANYNWDGGATSGNDFKQTLDVGQYEANRWGFFDMHGNVWEWTADRYGTYPTGNPVIDPSGAGSGTPRVRRGGSWSHDGMALRSAKREGNSPSRRSYSLGFRLGFQQINNNPNNLAPTTLLTIAENQSTGSIIGDFNATDPDAGATLTYHLVSGAGDGNNSLFTLEANGTLKTATTFDFETNASTYAIRVQAKDEFNATVEGNFTVTLFDIYENAEPANLNAANPISSPRSVSNLVLWLDAENVDDLNNSTFSGGDAVSSWRDLSGNDFHAVQSNTSRQPTFQTNQINGKSAVSFQGYVGLYAGNVSDSDSITAFVVSHLPTGRAYGRYLVKRWLSSHAGGIDFIDGFAFHLGNLNTDTTIYGDSSSYPSTYSYSPTVSVVKFRRENVKILNHLVVGSGSSSPHGLVWTHTEDNIAELLVFDAMLTDQQIISVKYYLASKWSLNASTDSDGDGVMDANDLVPLDPSFHTNTLPTDLNSIALLTIAENQPIGTIVGELNATDPDAGATLTYYLVSGPGDGNNSLFTLETNGTLKTAITFDYESNASTYSIRVQAKDEFNASVEGNFSVMLTDLYEAPPGQSNNDGNSSSDGNTTTEPTNPIVDGNASTDPNNPVADDNSSNEGNATILSPVPDYFRPIVDTLPSGEVNGTTAKLYGSVMDTGGLTLTEVGFLLSSRPNPKENASRVIRLVAESNASSFSAVAADLMAGKTYYFRAFTVNAEGTGYGFEESFETPAGPKVPTWIEAVPGKVKGWWTSPWLGNFYLNANGWARHEKLGWVFPVQSSTAGLWLWKEGFGWLWTDEAVYPFLYRNASGGWLYFYGRREETLLFYDYSTKDWIIRKDGQ